MSYADKLKQNTSKIKTSEKVLEDKKKSGRPKKPLEEIRNTAIPVALNKFEKNWIENQAKKLSKEIGVKITTSAWMRMVLLKDMPNDE
ncbi:hypothetical protein GCM10012288_07780 [Malaciobacter pacificus]|jgi:hypothetical protein|uniref:Uncharacterized protein n=1 Tax=Malaciobacter pacificus TaxID=1080223 RepID=A0A5C2H883_9BACT|nr:hypothetical protein [Malaciobacter pacificus]QEP35171.1 hypothetical protein APAC_2099 [Malaciobacter pacificus]GGD36215.1 hypothetical protein GCM10012288_07780 [Malaciobacter pacificus]